MYSIGEFSMASGIPVRTLRFYHEVGLLIPAAVDDVTHYRSYDEQNLERAKVLLALRSLDFSLEEIRAILNECRDDADLITQLERQRKTLDAKVQHYQSLIGVIDRLVESQRRSREAESANATGPAIVERDVSPLLVAGIRMKGSYSDCGAAFARLGKQLTWRIAGKPLCLFYDGEYREGDANFEPCMPIRQPIEVDGIAVHELPAVHCVTLVHRGPYEELNRSYARLMKHVKQRGGKISLPTREVYLKGPGMIFRGNPRNYLTEIQFPIEN
jgi:DNA-binding transcriptional MerR regulator/effector-binding domain-containing protein